MDRKIRLVLTAVAISPQICFLSDSVVWPRPSQSEQSVVCCYSAPNTGAEYCDERVCLSVCLCLFVRDHIFGTTSPIFTNFLHVTNGRGSVLLRRRSDTLYISGFMDDVIFAHKPSLLEVAAQLKRSAHASLGLVINCAQ